MRFTLLASLLVLSCATSKPATPPPQTPPSAPARTAAVSPAQAAACPSDRGIVEALASYFKLEGASANVRLLRCAQGRFPAPGHFVYAIDGDGFALTAIIEDASKRTLGRQTAGLCPEGVEKGPHNTAGEKCVFDRYEVLDLDGDGTDEGVRVESFSEDDARWSELEVLQVTPTQLVPHRHKLGSFSAEEGGCWKTVQIAEPAGKRRKLVLTATWKGPGTPEKPCANEELELPPAAP